MSRHVGFNVLARCGQSRRWFQRVNELIHELFNELIKKLASELDPAQIKKPISLTLFFLNESFLNLRWGVGDHGAEEE